MRTIFTGIAFLIAGGLIFAYTFYRLVSGVPLDPQTIVPGKVTADIATPGRYYLWDIYWTNFEGINNKYADDWPDEATIVVRDSNDSELEFVLDASQSWGIGNSAKSSVGYVDVAAKSTIRLVIEDVGRERIVSISNRTMQQELWSRLGGLGVGLIVAALGIPVTIVGLFLRRRASKAADQAG